MTDHTPPTPRRRPARRPSPLPVYAVSLAAFLGITGFLGTRMAHGQDPALGAAKPKATQVAQRRHVLVRKIVVTKHVTVVKPAPAAPSAGSGSTSAPASSAPAQASAPVQQQTYTPPPAPAPAPVQTATS